MQSVPPAFHTQNFMNRRNFLQTAALTSAAPTLPAIEPFHRKYYKFSGLSMTSYSMKPHMKWWWGKKREEGKMDMLGFLDYCAELGLDAAEITSYFFKDPLTSSYINQVKRRAHLNGLDISGAAMGNNFGYKPGSPENLSHMNYFRKWVDHFAEMGATVVLFFASKKIPKGQSDEQTIYYVTTNLEIACEYASKKGIILGLENHDFVKKIDYLLAIINRIDTPWLGVIWDSANISPTPCPYTELTRIAPYAVTAQVKVMTKVNGEEVPADYTRLLNILRQANYRGYIVFEYEEDEDPYTAIPPHVSQLRRLI